MMSNKLFVAGKSGNPTGRPNGTRYSILTTKGRIERFLSKNMTATALQKLYNGLKETEKLKLLTELLPYVLAKQSPEGISPEEVNRLYDMVANQKEQITGMANKIK